MTVEICVARRGSVVEPHQLTHSLEACPLRSSRRRGSSPLFLDDPLAAGDAEEPCSDYSGISCVASAPINAPSLQAVETLLKRKVLS